MSDAKGRLNAIINHATAGIEKNTEVFNFGTSVSKINNDLTVTSIKVKRFLANDKGDKK